MADKILSRKCIRLYILQVLNAGRHTNLIPAVRSRLVSCQRNNSAPANLGLHLASTSPSRAMQVRTSLFCTTALAIHGVWILNEHRAHIKRHCSSLIPQGNCLFVAARANSRTNAVLSTIYAAFSAYITSSVIETDIEQFIRSSLSCFVPPLPVARLRSFCS